MSTMMCPRCWNKRKRPCDKCMNKGRVDDVRLSQNFSLSEMLYSEKAVELGVSNDPTSMQVSRIMDATQNLYQPVRDGIGPMKVTSGFRSLELNTAVKGAKGGAHPAAWALDSQPELMSLEGAMRWLWNNKQLKFDQAILELGKHHDRTNDDWLHLGFRHPTTYIQRREFLIMEDGIYRAWQPSS